MNPFQGLDFDIQWPPPSDMYTKNDGLRIIAEGLMPIAAVARIIEGEKESGTPEHKIDWFVWLFQWARLPQKTKEKWCRVEY